MAEQAEHPEIKDSLERIAGKLNTGQPLHKALESERAFSVLETGLVKVGLDSGSLHTVLMKLADLSEKREQLRNKLTSAMIYPAFVLSLCTLLLIFAPVFVFSDLLNLLRELKTELPLATKIYLGFSSLILSPFFYLAAIVVVAGVVGFAQKILSEPFRRRSAEELLFSLPGVGGVLKNSLAAQAAQAVAICYSAGLPIVRAISLSRDVTWSVVLQHRMSATIVDLQNGHSLAESLKATGFFSPMSLTILAGGEEVGLIAEALRNVEKTTSEATTQALDTMEKLVEPFILLFIGILVGFIAIATLAPTLQVVQQI